MPLFFAERERRIDREIPIGAEQSAELDRYLTWASDFASMARSEVLFRMFEQLLDGYFRREKLWNQVKRGRAADPEPTTPDGDAGT